METSSIDYRVLYHRSGYIRVQVPSLKRRLLFLLYKDLRKSLPFPLPSAIKDFSIDPLSGSLVIQYNPDAIDILEFISEMSKNPDLQTMIKG